MSKRALVDKYLEDSRFLDFLREHGLTLQSSTEELYRAAIEYYTMHNPIVNDGNLSI